MKKILILTLSILLAYPIMAQVKVTFTQRTSIYTPNQKIYNIKGDFQMIGNTNLTLKTYGDNTNNSNNEMIYVDKDTDPNTLNSSSATLSFSTENGAAPACSNIIYAGLYWTGRAHDGGNSPMEFDITTNRTNENVFNGYTLSITSAVDNSNNTSSDNRRITTYTFTPTVSGDAVVFRYYTWSSTSGSWPFTTYYNKVTVQTGSGTVNEIYNSNGYVSTVSFTAQTIGTGANQFKITSLSKDGRTNNTINDSFYAVSAHNLNKREVKLKKSGQTYQTITAAESDIYYPMTDDGQMYSAYAEVTDYVKQHGIGEYFVADMALREGNGGSTGYYGGWGMIVVYENSKMKWRDVTIFDGHAYIAGTTDSHKLSVSGFHTAQNGAVNMKLGIIAGEGDVGISGDYFQILPHDKLSLTNPSNSDWVSLSHTDNAKNNFFNGSIIPYSVSTPTRNPNLKNNTGLDIAMFDVTNTNNSIITNNQTSTNFRYGSTRDTYIISAIAMAVDAYVPDIVPAIKITNLNGNPVSTVNSEVLPGEDIEYVLEIKNGGNEAVNNAVIEIPIPYNATYVSSSAQYWLGTGASGNNQPQLITGNPSILRWNIGTIPKPSDPNSPLAKLTFKLKATSDCFILVNKDCSPIISVEGTATGIGASSNANFNIRFVRGYRDGTCNDEPILGPLPTAINADDYVADHCAGFDYTTRNFAFCKPHTGNLNFTEIASNFPAGVRFYNDTIMVRDADSGNIYVKPANNATEYTATNSFPATEGTFTYYALPSGATTCYWKFNIVVTKCNLWMGNTSQTNGTLWSLASNWTNSIVPATNEDVEFATVANYGVAAVNDLHLDQNRSIGNLKNQTTNRALVVTNNNRLIITQKAIVTDVNSIRVQSKRDQGNGSLVFTKPAQNTGLQATVEFDSKSQRVTTGSYPREWQYIGSPIIGAIPTAVFGSDVSGSKNGANESIRKYNEAKDNSGDIGDKWDEVNVTAPMASFAGYEFVQNARDAEVYQYKGTLHLSDFSTPALGFTSGVYYRGNYILANSYTAPIKISKLIATDFENLEQAIYLYNTGSRDQWLTDIQANPSISQNDAVIPGAYFGVPSLVAGTLHDNLQIPSMNGFLVRRLSTGYNSINPIRFNFRYASLDDISSATQAMRVKQTGMNANEQKLPLLKISVQGSTWNDYTYLITAPGTSKVFDNGWDSRKILTASDDQIYVLTSQNERFQVSSDENINGTTLGFYRKTSDTRYTMKFYLTDMENVYSDLYLEDLATGTQTRITDGVAYSFNADSSSPESRFRIHALRTGDIATGNLDDVLSINYYNDKAITALNSSDDEGTLNVFDVAGKTLLSEPLSKGITQLKVNLPNGVYIIEAKTQSNKKNLKIVIQ